MLIVDDDAVIRQVLRRTLEKAEYDVVEAVDGVEAIAILTTSAHRVSAVLSDITMPRLDGLALVEFVHHAHPTVPVVLASGAYTVNTLPALIARSISAFLPKPYSRSSVLTAVASAIDGCAGP